MYGNQDFSQRPPYMYNARCQSQIGANQSNLNYSSNYRNMRQNFRYPSNIQSSSVYTNDINFNPRSNNVADEEASLIALLQMREQDEQMIENFLKENEHEFEIKKKTNNDQGSNISETRTALVSACQLNNELKKICNELKENRDISETEWCEKIAATQRKRDEIMKTIQKLEDVEFMKKVKKNIQKRKKKRLREKKQRASINAEKLAAEERRIQLHAKADAWIKDKQDIIEKEKQEVSMRKDADLVLGEVRGRRHDAKKFLALLQEMRNLRKIQVNIARARGEHLSAAADEAFTNIIEKLVEQWTAMDREYSMEEQGLKLMLKTDNELKIKKQKRNIFDDWENVLFGRKLPNVDSLQRNIHAFVTRRIAWDKYISYDGLGSPIPIGWVMPEPPSSAAWQKYLKKE